MGIIGTGMVFCLPKLPRSGAIALILFTSLAVRLAVLPTASSDDVNRYLWEGKLYAQGISPFTEVAEHEIYESHRDEFWEQMNHKDKLTAYPPLSLHIFSFINSFSYSPMSYKVAFLIFDLFLIALILAILYHHQRPLQWALIYALSPISVISFAAEGHFDVLMMLFLTLSLFAYSKKWMVLCGAAFGLAVATKIMVVIAAPIILWRTRFKGMAAAAIFCAAPFLLHFDDTLQMINGLVSFGSKNNFNGAFNQFFDDIIGLVPGVANKICFSLFCFSWLTSFWLSLKGRLWVSLLFCFGGLILFAPIVHFWYLAWVLPFVAIRPSLPWISLSITAPLYFLVHSHYNATGYWELPFWAKWVFYLPFFVISAFYLPSLIRTITNQLRGKTIASDSSETPTWSVVIPTLKIDSAILTLIKELENQSVVPDELVLVSPSHTDQASPSSNHFAITTATSKLGRGQQIKTGVEAATSQWCLILHGDNLLAPDTFKVLNRALMRNPQIIGGSLGQRFDRSNLRLFLIEFLNDVRANFLKTSFGDQNQFFHRTTAIENDILTDQPLMEDVEISDRLKHQGETLHLAYESTVSARKWKSSSFWSRFSQIIGFYFKYRTLFYSSSKRSELSTNFYESYYGGKPK